MRLLDERPDVDYLLELGLTPELDGVMYDNVWDIAGLQIFNEHGACQRLVA